MAPNTLPVRPTTDRAKEALFNILENRYFFNSKDVLDLFSGTGSIAFEFASRGCEKILAVDNNFSCINYIEKTNNNLKFNISTIKSDALQYLKNCKQEFNFIFADPPYCKSPGDVDYIEQLLADEHLAACLAEGGLLVLEDSSDNKRGTHDGWELLDQRSYGGCGILFYQRQSSR